MRKVRTRKTLETEQQMGKARVKMKYLMGERSSFGQIRKVALKSPKVEPEMFENDPEKFESATQN